MKTFVKISFVCVVIAISVLSSGCGTPGMKILSKLAAKESENDDGIRLDKDTKIQTQVRSAQLPEVLIFRNGEGRILQSYVGMVDRSGHTIMDGDMISFGSDAVFRQRIEGKQSDVLVFETVEVWDKYEIRKEGADWKFYYMGSRMRPKSSTN